MTKNVNVRLDDELHESLKAAAAADDRSLNSEIVSMLKEGLKQRYRRSLREGGRVPDENLGELLSTFDLPELRSPDDPG